jgi:putative selenium metabolism hydrolase
VPAVSAQRLAEAIAFLREIVAIPSPSGGEEAVARRVAAQMERLGFAAVHLDSFGSVIGRLGVGPRVILYDAHIDTVGVGDPSAWPHDPYRGKHKDGWIWGRGASDNKGGLAAILYGAALAAADLPPELSLVVVGSAMEEDCDGIAYQTIIAEDGLRPELALLAECTGLRVYRGQRGRMEMTVTARGASCHASAPERGANAITRMASIVQGVDALNRRLSERGADSLLGPGTAAVTRIASYSPSLNAVPDRCEIFVDRRLTTGDTRESALAELRELAGEDAEVAILVHEAAGWTGRRVRVEKVFPAWLTPLEHAGVQAALDAAREALGREPESGVWTFSTNGVYTAGVAGIPTLGFGPAIEEYTHSTADRVSEEDMAAAIDFYASFPRCYARRA